MPRIRSRSRYSIARIPLRFPALRPIRPRTNSRRLTAIRRAGRQSAPSGVVNPSVGQVIVTGFAPAITVTNNKRVAPSVGAVTVTGFAPTVTVTQNFLAQPQTGTIGITGNSPVLSGVQSAVDTHDGAGPHHIKFWRDQQKRQEERNRKRTEKKRKKDEKPEPEAEIEIGEPVKVPVPIKPKVNLTVPIAKINSLENLVGAIQKKALEQSAIEAAEIERRRIEDENDEDDVATLLMLV